MEEEEMSEVFKELGRQLEESDPEWFAAMVDAIKDWEEDRERANA